MSTTASSKPASAKRSSLALSLPTSVPGGNPLVVEHLELELLPKLGKSQEEVPSEARNQDQTVGQIPIILAICLLPIASTPTPPKSCNAPVRAHIIAALGETSGLVIGVAVPVPSPCRRRRSELLLIVAPILGVNSAAPNRQKCLIHLATEQRRQIRTVPSSNFACEWLGT